MTTDNEIILFLKQGAPTALETAIKTYGGYVAAVVRHTLGNTCSTQDVEELVSDVFVRLWKNTAKLDENSSLKAWLAVVARNCALNKARSIRPTDELQEDFFISEAGAVATELEKKEQVQMVQHAVNDMNASYRDIFIRYYFWQQSIDTIAAETGTTPSAVKSKLHRGRNALKSTLTQKGGTL